MARSGKITYKQAARFLLDIECGRMTSAEASRLNGVTEAAISLWRPYIGLNEKWLTRVKQLERQVTVLTRRAELSERKLGICTSVLRILEPSSKKRALFATAIKAQHALYRTHANQMMGVCVGTAAIKVTRDADAALVASMRHYLAENPGQGFKGMFRILLKDRGCTRNHALKLYTNARLGHHFRKGRLQLPGRVENRIRAIGSPDRNWSMDFMLDVLPSGQRFFVLNAVDDWNRECLFSRALPRSSTRAVVAELEAMRLAGRVPQRIRTDNGGEFKSLEYQAWAKRRQVRLVYVRPHSPLENMLIERFNGTLRREIFNWYEFQDLDQVQRMLDDWRIRYNLARPHHALGGLSPVQYAHLARIQAQPHPPALNSKPPRYRIRRSGVRRQLG